MVSLPPPTVASPDGGSAPLESGDDGASEREHGLSPRWQLVIDKAFDFLLVFVGLYAAIAVQRYQEEQKNRHEYGALLKDFESELRANKARYVAFENMVGPLEVQSPRAVLGPMVATFDRFSADLEVEESFASCLHRELLVASKEGGRPRKGRCRDDSQAGAPEALAVTFEPIALSPFFRFEVWELYVTSSGRIFENKDLAVRIGEVYNDMRSVERQIASVESTYNETFVRQLGLTAATSVELEHLATSEPGLRRPVEQDLARLTTVEDSISRDRRSALEAKSILELKVRSIKRGLTRTMAETNALIRELELEVERTDSWRPRS